ncbi:ABC transporter ATP-binding protein [Xanthomarina gelatinilytica]|uniref:ABC transporter ATP-binding protein n=1 Tax=Xanthomarina gelatinilytica TaxID=1137281 RepID=UPI003AA9461A
MTILKAENISKQYRLGLVGTGTLSHDLNRWWAGIRGKEDPYLKVGSVNDRSTKADSAYVWALKDINFEVQQGEVLGIIGKNGAGKSTLLKILSRVTIPTTGEIKTKGRIASLLEVGTGFHPELTGRENIYLNGAILGMSKAEIKSKEAEIIAFSGCERYVDTPVKRYSSGMRVRLAFAVAAFLEPDILVIDEVLAVGDAEFQKKAIGKMQDISKGDGRTVLFVSHNMAAVKSLCTRAIVLEHGRTVFEGGTDEAVDFYLNNENMQLGSGIADYKDVELGTGDLQLLQVSVTDNMQRIRTAFLQSEAIHVQIIFLAKTELKGMRINLSVKNSYGVVAFVTSSHELTKSGISKGEHTLKLIIPAYLLNKTQYTLTLNAGIPGKRVLIEPIDILLVNIEGENAGGSTYIEKWPGLVSPKLEWTLDE